VLAALLTYLSWLLGGPHSSMSRASTTSRRQRSLPSRPDAAASRSSRSPMGCCGASISASWPVCWRTRSATSPTTTAGPFLAL